MSCERLITIYHSLFNAPFAAISALVNGGIAGIINVEYGGLEALASAGTQGAASFLSTGFTARLVQYFSPIENRLISYGVGSLVPAMATFLISYVGHFMNETPELLKSCIVPTIISYTTSYATNYITRCGYFLPGNYRTKIRSESPEKID